MRRTYEYRAVTGIFISYRRDLSRYQAGWLYEELVLEFGREAVFKDIDNIAPGEDFQVRLKSAVDSCAILLVLIGPSWATARSREGSLRLGDPNDLVRVEVEMALKRQIRVIPVLVDGATMPTVNELPASLRDLATRQAHELTPNRFKRDTKELVQILRPTLRASRWRRPPRLVLLGAALVGVIALTAFLWLILAKTLGQPDLPTAAEPLGPEYLLWPRPRD